MLERRKSTPPSRLQIAMALLSGTETKVTKALITAEALLAADEKRGPQVDGAQATDLCRELMHLHSSGELLIAPTEPGLLFLKKLKEFLSELSAMSAGGSR